MRFWSASDSHDGYLSRAMLASSVSTSYPLQEKAISYFILITLKCSLSPAKWISTGRVHGYPLHVRNPKSALFQCWSDTLSSQIFEEMLINTYFEVYRKQSKAIACGPMVVLATQGYVSYSLRYSKRSA